MTANVPPFDLRAVLDRAATRPTRTVRLDTARWVVGTLATWNFLAPDNNCYLRLASTAFDNFIECRSSGAPEIPVVIEHQGCRVGVVRSLAARSDGLMAVLIIDRGKEGDDVLRAVDDGRLTGLSVNFDVFRTQRAEHHHGLRVIEAVEATIKEASLCAEPADPECLIMTVGGRRPKWHSVRDAIERDAWLQRELQVRPR